MVLERRREVAWYCRKYSIGSAVLFARLHFEMTDPITLLWRSLMVIASDSSSDRESFVQGPIAQCIIRSRRHLYGGFKSWFVAFIYWSESGILVWTICKVKTRTRLVYEPDFIFGFPIRFYGGSELFIWRVCFIEVLDPTHVYCSGVKNWSCPILNRRSELSIWTVSLWLLSDPISYSVLAHKFSGPADRRITKVLFSFILVCFFAAYKNKRSEYYVLVCMNSSANWKKNTAMLFCER